MNHVFKPILIAAFGVSVFSMANPVFSQEITGAGATFPAPLYSKWAADYNKATGVKVNYQSVGVWRRDQTNRFQDS
jgi:phosphate transport system substrate-binding protein